MSYIMLRMHNGTLEVTSCYSSVQTFNSLARHHIFLNEKCSKKQMLFRDRKGFLAPSPVPSLLKRQSADALLLRSRACSLCSLCILKSCCVMNSRLTS